MIVKKYCVESHLHNIACGLQLLDELVQFAKKEVLVYEGFQHGDEPGMFMSNHGI